MAVVGVALVTLAGSVGYLASKAGGGLSATLGYAVGHAFAFAAWGALALSPRLRAATGRAVTRLGMACGGGRGVLLVLLIVTGLRVAWVLLVPTEPSSDNAVYHGLACRLLETGQYDTAKHRAYWPPGYPLFLAGVYALCGAHLLAAKLANVVLAAGVDLLAWRIARRHLGRTAAGVALLLTAAWPARNFHVDVLSYDELTLALLLGVLALLLACWPRRERLPLGTFVVAGVLLGLGCLVRPTLIIMPAILGGWLLLRTSLWRSVVLAGVCGVAMLAVVSPWTLRNYRELGAFVPISSNAGVNFYTSWAPTSDGGFDRTAARDLLARAGDDELEASRLGFQLGWAAIRENPARALRQLYQKQVHYLGSDNWLLPVETYVAALGSARGTTLKLALHTLTNAVFLLLILLPLLGVRRLRSALAGAMQTGAHRNAAASLALLCLTLFLTGWLTHTVFQAQARYHLVYLPLWGLLLAALWRGGAGGNVGRWERRGGRGS